MTEVRRNHYGHYLVVPPNGDKPVGYRRMTTIAKTLDSGGGLIPWKATATVVGALRRPGLLAGWQALIAEHPDPWYGSEESKKRCKVLVEQSATAGGSTDRADIGTALHAVIETSSRNGWTTSPLVGSMQADVEAYRTTLDAAGIVVDPAYVEACVVLDGLGVAGTSDNLRITVPGRGDIVADLKTGADLKYSWQAIAIQLAGYAHADAVYVQGEAPDGSQDERRPMPEISQEWGMVIHLPAGEGRCDLYLVDLVAGWEALQSSLAVERWRKRSNLAQRYEVVRPAQHPAAAPAGVPDDFDAPMVVTGETITEMLAVEALVVDDFDAPMVPAPAWKSDPNLIVCARPNKQPTLREAAAIRAAIDAAHGLGGVATAESAPPQENPAPPAVAAVPDPALPTDPDEGADLSGPDHAPGWALLQEHFKALDKAGQSWIWALVHQSEAHGADFHAKGRTHRRFEIYRGLIALATVPLDDDDIVRALVALAMRSDAPLFAGVELGHAVGALSVSSALVFAQLVDELIAGQLSAVVDDDGTMRLTPAA